MKYIFKFILFILFGTLLDCNAYSNKFDKSGLDIFNLLLFEKNIYDSNNTANWSIRGKLTKKSGVAIQNARISLVSKVLRANIDNTTTSDSSGIFLMNLVYGIITLKVIDSSGNELGQIKFTISQSGEISTSIPEAVDLSITQLSSYFNSGDWLSITSSQLCRSGSCMRSNYIGNLSSSTMSQKYTNVKKISFYYFVSSESNYDFCNFYIDGQTKFTNSGVTTYALVTYSFTQGAHTFVWVYSKDSSSSSGYDACFVDSITTE